MPYKKYDPEFDRLEEGAKIRLAGREGVIDDVNGHRAPNNDYADMHFVKWSDGFSDNATLGKFPELEIFDQPLTIPRQTKKIVLEKYLDPKINHETFRAFLESLEVTND